MRVRNWIEGYSVSQNTEVKHAIWVTLAGTIAVILLICAYAFLDFLQPDVVVNTAGKLESVKDHWSLVRSLILKTAGALTGGMVLGWFVLIFNHITPTDYLMKVSEDSRATAYVILGLLGAGAYIWCFG